MTDSLSSIACFFDLVNCERNALEIGGSASDILYAGSSAMEHLRHTKIWGYNKFGSRRMMPSSIACAGFAVRFVSPFFENSYKEKFPMQPKSSSPCVKGVPYLLQDLSYMQWGKLGYCNLARAAGQVTA